MMNRLRTVRILLWILVALAVAGLALLLLRPATTSAPETTQASAVSFGGPFTLVGGDGQPFASSRLGGKPYAIFFGFTHCPDVCPTTLARLVRLRRELGEDGGDLQILFVSVDPERDTPEVMAKYATLFTDPVIALTGSPAQIEQVKKQYGIHSRKVAGHHGSEYSVDHTASVLLFGTDGKFVATIAPEENDQVALDKLRRITA